MRYLITSALSVVFMLTQLRAELPKVAGEKQPARTSIPANFVRIPGGLFEAGNPVQDQASPAYRVCEKHERTVSVDDFYLSRFLVTAEEYCLFLNDAGDSSHLVLDTGWVDWKTITLADGVYAPKKFRERSPAYPVTWRGAQAYCEWLTAKTGVVHRLPTEMEWEYAARGPEGRAWPWGDSPPLVYAGSGRRFKASSLAPELESGLEAPAFEYMDPKDYCVRPYEMYGERWSCSNWNQEVPWMGSPVGSYPRNATPLGVYDLLGYDAGQWCVRSQDWDVGYANHPGVVRGLARVSVEHRPGLRKSWLLLLIPGDAKSPIDTPGRSWSRGLSKEVLSGAMLRLAVDAPAAE
jgi:formylglycine-generating enzyme required for sulfatase activity